MNPSLPRLKSAIRWSHRLTVCKPREQVCQVEPFSPPDLVAPKMTQAGAQKQAGLPGREDLGKQLVDGLETVGTRETTVIETGAIGNNSPSRYGASTGIHSNWE